MGENISYPICRYNLVLLEKRCFLKIKETFALLTHPQDDFPADKEPNHAHDFTIMF